MVEYHVRRRYRNRLIDRIWPWNGGGSTHQVGVEHATGQRFAARAMGSRHPDTARRRYGCSAIERAVFE